MTEAKNQKEIEIMKKAGHISAKAVDLVVKNIKPGVTLLELDQIAYDFIVSNGGKPSFMTVDDYKFTTCINVNSGIVHGIPNHYKVIRGDVVSIDLGTMIDGLHSDISYTVEVETHNHKRFLDIGKKALNDAIKMCKAGNRIGDVSNAMQQVIEKHGFSVSRDLVGHGIGYELHEDPYVPCYGKKGTGPVLFTGMTIAVEVIYQYGKPEIVVLSDDWTIATADGSISGLFEHTVLVTSKGPLILTK